MGRRPTPSGALQFKSAITTEGSPIEYSWKWNTRSPNSQPDIRYSLEPLTRDVSGTPADSQNQIAWTTLIRSLAKTFGADLEWTEHFLSCLFDEAQAKRATELAEAGTPAGTTLAMAAEFVPSGLCFKTYCAPRAVTGDCMPTTDLFTPALEKLHPESVARSALMDFLANDPEGHTMLPLMLAVDCVAPVKSRLKWYFVNPHTSFASVKSIITLGGRRPNMEHTLDEVRSLIHAALGLPPGFPDDQELPTAVRFDHTSEHFVGPPPSEAPPGLIYYFDIRPDTALPEVKIYVPVWRYAENDAAAARGIAGWMTERGRGAYASRFAEAMEGMVAAYRSLESDTGLQASVGIVCTEGEAELGVTTYMSPEAKRAVTMRREEVDGHA